MKVDAAWLSSHRNLAVNDRAEDMVKHALTTPIHIHTDSAIDFLDAQALPRREMPGCPKCIQLDSVEYSLNCVVQNQSRGICLNE